MRIKKGQRLEIDWLDSGYVSGWQSKENVHNRINKHSFDDMIKTTGYYISEDKLQIYLCMSYNNDCYCDLMYIPKKMIQKIKKI